MFRTSVCSISFLRAVLWQYWFSTQEQKRATGAWWRRTLLGTYAPMVMQMQDGRYGIVADAELNGPPTP